MGGGADCQEEQDRMRLKSHGHALELWLILFPLLTLKLPGSRKEL